MTREIKFRAWDKEDKLLYESKYADMFIRTDGVLYDEARATYDTPNKEIEKVKVDRYELMQFTGLKDKNGKEIYEGDIVRVPDDYEEYGFMAGEQREIYYLDGCFRLKPKKENTRDRGNTIMDDMDKCEIIGNIYENPNLLN